MSTGLHISQSDLDAVSEQVHRATVATGCFLATAWISVALRFGVRGIMIRCLGWDDWLMLVTIVGTSSGLVSSRYQLMPRKVTFTLYCTFVILSENLALDFVLGKAGLSDLSSMVDYFLAAISTYILTTVLFKAALGLFYLRIVISRRLKYVSYVTLGVSMTFGIAYLFFTLFQCGSPHDLVEKRIGGKCVSDKALLAVGLSEGAVNASADWILGLLPIFPLYKANMPRPAKLSASFVILLGAAGSVCSVVRLPYITDFAPGSDFFLKSSRLVLWSVAECGICIIAASLATLRPLVRTCLEGARESLTRSGHSRQKNTGTSHSTSGRYDQMHDDPSSLSGLELQPRAKAVITGGIGHLQDQQHAKLWKPRSYRIRPDARRHLRAGDEAQPPIKEPSTEILYQPSTHQEGSWEVAPVVSSHEKRESFDRDMIQESTPRSTRVSTPEDSDLREKSFLDV
ncbi:hypothetical protein KC343_g2513 [Hortaea werneckii]|nr:hypothetical protein KC352_g13895 [Hortaea werneckii]KAI7571767.1 hypothetical protein KC317_g1348 [Hortaea werneckii]KAI7623797.1 hypothetical protein KC346_g2538 [Hortaea werneckii]KAI7634230.1 hypothetical protein KC343_g2513 [Hortaea werneckii]KAI7682269.1 hypothetical protein KC319_g1099 [Hortaea werneckii]